MDCPYCGHKNNDSNTVCERCKATFPVEKQEEKQPKKAIKKNDKE